MYAVDFVRASLPQKATYVPHHDDANAYDDDDGFGRIAFTFFSFSYFYCDFFDM